MARKSNQFNMLENKYTVLNKKESIFSSSIINVVRKSL